MSPWELRLSAAAQRSLDSLPERFAAAVAELVVGPLLDAPTRVGKPLRGELAGYRAARRGAYRVVHRIDVAAHRVDVVRIDHRANVYRAWLRARATGAEIT